MAYEISWEPDGLYCRMHGEVPISEIVRSIEDETADPRYKSASYRITDFLDATSQNVTLGDVEGLSTIDAVRKELNANVLDAIVVTDPVITKLVQYWVATNERPDSIGIFTTMADAKAWLGQRAGKPVAATPR